MYTEIDNLYEAACANDIFGRGEWYACIMIDWDYKRDLTSVDKRDHGGILMTIYLASLKTRHRDTVWLNLDIISFES